MSNEIKIHLSTYLKDSGIKATEAQVSRLSKQIVKANKQAAASARDFGGELGQIEGPLGKLQKAFGGVLGKGMAVFAALKVGMDIGNWVYDKVITPLFDIKDPLEELRRENRELKRQADEACAAWEETFSAWQDGWAAQVSGAERARTAIEDATQAYLKMQQARERVQKAGDDADMLGLERDKFNTMAGAGTAEEAAAAGHYYDVLIAEKKAKQDLARFDREAEVSARKLLSAEEQLMRTRDKRVALARQLKSVDRQIEKMDSMAAVDTYGFDATEKQYQKLLAERRRIEAAYNAAARDYDKRKADVAAAREGAGALSQERANMQARAQLEIAEKVKAYEDYMREVEARDEAAWQDEQARIQAVAQAELKARQEMEAKLAAERLANLRTELATRQREEAAAQSRHAAAEGDLQRAWSLYRNQGQMQAAIDEHKAQQEAEKRWERDFSRLKSRHRDWRDIEFGELSAHEESVRQVALAKESKAAAERAVLETAENTRDLARKVEELLAMKGG